jgi:hypothetical protein
MKHSPIWLQPRWERRKQETVSRVTAAVEKLRQEAREVTFSNICVAVRELYGVSISSNTLKRNDSAYQIYLAHRKPPKKGIGRQRGLQDLLASATGLERDQLASKISRLRRKSKDTLIAKLITLERRVRRQTEVENRLREEVIRLDLTSRGIDQGGADTVRREGLESADVVARVRG